MASWSDHSVTSHVMARARSLAAELGGQLAEPVGGARGEREAVAGLDGGARGGGADARGGAGDEEYGIGS